MRITLKAAANAAAMKGLLGKSKPLVPIATVVACAVLFPSSNPTMMKTSPQAVPKDGRHKKDSQLPLVTMKELQKHTDMDSLWVVYKGIVYDVTDFTLGHPGGTDRLLMAAGMDLEPYFDIYTEHYRGHVLPFLQRFKIGRLTDADAAKVKKFEFSNPYANDPERHPDLLHCTTHPFNGEPRIERLTESYYTPNELHYVRNHLPVPDIDDDDWELEVSGTGVTKPQTFTLKDIKTKFKKDEVVNCYQCAGNRREDFHGNIGPDGDEQLIYISPHWVVGAFSNAKWGGARMRDILAYCGMDVDAMALGKIDPHSKGMKHVQFEGYDETETGITYGSSVPIDKVLDPHGGCLVAYEMNGVPTPPDHGKPARAMIPGHAGCRSCKWLHKIIVAEKESTKPWQDKSYLGFAPDMRFEGDMSENGQMGRGLWKWSKDPELKKYLDYQQYGASQHLGRAICQIQPVTSIICNPPQATCLTGNPDFVELKGCAHSWGGNGINRVDVSIDGGKHWTASDLIKPDDVLKKERFGKMFGWTQFSKKVQLHPDMKDQLAQGKRVYLECVSKAVDTHFNVQPEQKDAYYNARGVVINHMYRVPVVVDPNEYRGKRKQEALQKAHNDYYKPGENPQGRTGQEFPNKPTGGIFQEPWVHDRRA
jgi:sulfite oxidase